MIILDSSGKGKALMREILFRGKIIDEPNEWAYGSLVINQKTNDCVIHSFGGEHIGMFHVDPSTVGQYIGLQDKNGTKIFEGDICILSFDGKNIESNYFTVKWNSGNLEYVAENNEESIGLGYASVLDIIGNIHDKIEEIP